MTRSVTCGFVPLTDAAPLVLARELGFAEEEGLDIVLKKETSWSSIRDKLAFGIYDAAHLLSPMALAMSLGKEQVDSKIYVPMVLNLNGNSLAFSQRFLSDNGAGPPAFNAAREWADFLIRCGNKRPVRIGVPFMHSMHVALLRYLVAQSGGDPSRMIEFSVAPPFILAEVLRSGEVDGVFVGAPWATGMIDDGHATLALNGSAIWAAAPEKVLGVNRRWASENADTLDRLIRAVFRVQLWMARPGSLHTMCEILAQPNYVGTSSDLIQQAISGQMILDRNGSIVTDNLAIRFGGVSVSFPWVSAAQWIAVNEAPYWGVDCETARKTASECFRPDIYRRALAALNVPMPPSNRKLEGSIDRPSDASADGDLVLGPDLFFDGAVFEPT